MRRSILAGVGTLAAAFVLATPAYGDSGVQHLTFSFDEQATSHLDAIGSGCPDFTGTLLEQRHDELAGIVKADGTVHGRTTATSSAVLVPDDPAGTSYTGGYSFHQSGTFVDGGTTDRIVTSVVHGTMSGSDGSSFRFTELVHFSVDAGGTVRVSFDKAHCS